ncbi:hypothetical protein ES332_A08G198300v1 [Gossypium tomentosum]|uniref:Uncharacterized protein n=1 Tax=Gossypium tomentosum TaxID=34277 RepID=A0A5D2PH32_GOSTO|nr:hypothetical protein ES332_A08G198300v1 [Gossypium tomentosum]
MGTPTASLRPLLELFPSIKGVNLDPNGSLSKFATPLALKSRNSFHDFLSTNIRGPKSLFFPSPPPSTVSLEITTVGASIPSKTVSGLSKIAPTPTNEHNSLTCPYHPQLKQTVGRDSYSTRWMSSSTKTFEVRGLSRLTNTANRITRKPW